MAQLLRLLILLAGVWLVIYIIRQALARRRRAATAHSPDPIPRMLRCERCGTYIPESEAVTFRGKVYCSEAHRREDAC